MFSNKIIVALDFDDKKSAFELVEKLDPRQCRLKVGKEMFTLYGPEFVKQLMQRGFQIFLDLKFHDIPNTVAKAVRAAAELGVWMVNVHALGGLSMLQAAKDALKDFSKKPLLIGVTILTSHTSDELQQMGLSADISMHVLQLAKLCQQAGFDGVVCSAQEAALIREHLGSSFILVTPGIRLSTSPADDQKRILTPKEAIAQGADYLVIGRPITQAKDPQKVLAEIVSTLLHTQ